MESPETVTVIDYEITFASGKETSFTVSPHRGETETLQGKSLHYCTAAGHEVSIDLSRVDVLSRRERQMRVAPEVYQPKTPNVRVSESEPSASAH